MSNENLDVNTSEQGDVAIISEELRNFNWGAFLLTWIWGLGNRSYITLLSLLSVVLCIIPFIGWIVPLAFSIWFGIKGNEWAWKNKKFASIEAFNDYQRKWAIAGIIVTILCMIIGIFLGSVIAAAIISMGMQQ